MPVASKDKYTAKQKRKAQHIEDSYKHKGMPEEQAQARAWATVNKQSGGGEKAGGSGTQTSAREKETARSDSAKRAAQTRKGHERTSPASLQSQTRESLMKEAQGKDIRGRSRMTKAQLIEALSHTH